MSVDRLLGWAGSTGFLNKIRHILMHAQHRKSLSCAHLQQTILKQQALTERKASLVKFVPFCNERHLGKLIVSKPQETPAKRASDEQLIEKINFKNFTKIYQMVLRYEDQRYSQTTRKPDQRDLLNNEWQVRSIGKRPTPTPTPTLTPTLSQHPHQSSSQGSQRGKQSAFDKMNLQLFKKLSQVRQPGDNPELQELYSNYIRVSELNENIRREELTGRRKG